VEYVIDEYVLVSIVGGAYLLLAAFASWYIPKHEPKMAEGIGDCPAFAGAAAALLAMPIIAPIIAVYRLCGGTK